MCVYITIPGLKVRLRREGSSFPPHINRGLFASGGHVTHLSDKNDNDQGLRGR